MAAFLILSGFFFLSWLLISSWLYSLVDPNNESRNKAIGSAVIGVPVSSILTGLLALLF